MSTRTWPRSIAIAIVFDFVNPVLALTRLIDRGSKLWLDES